MSVPKNVPINILTDITNKLPSIFYMSVGELPFTLNQIETVRRPKNTPLPTLAIKT